MTEDAGDRVVFQPHVLYACVFLIIAPNTIVVISLAKGHVIRVNLTTLKIFSPSSSSGRRSYRTYERTEGLGKVIFRDCFAPAKRK